MRWVNCRVCTQQLSNPNFDTVSHLLCKGTIKYERRMAVSGHLEPTAATGVIEHSCQQLRLVALKVKVPCEKWIKVRGPVMPMWYSFSQFLALEDIMLPLELQSIVHETAICRNRHNSSLLDSWVTHTHKHTHTLYQNVMSTKNSSPCIFIKYNMLKCWAINGRSRFFCLL